MIEYDFGALLQALLDAGVEFVVVGGVAATLNGVPINTFDVDVAHRRTEENVDRLMSVLDALDAVYRMFMTPARWMLFPIPASVRGSPSRTIRDSPKPAMLIL